MANEKLMDILHWNINPISDDVKNSGNKLFYGLNFVPWQQPNAVLKVPISSKHYTLTGGSNAVESSWNVMAHGDAREGKRRGNWRMEWVASTLTVPRIIVYPALLPLMRTTRLPVVDWTDTAADLNGLVRFAERRSLVSARAPPHFKHSLQTYTSV